MFLGVFTFKHGTIHCPPTDSTFDTWDLSPGMGSLTGRRFNPPLLVEQWFFFIVATFLHCKPFLVSPFD
jgi:hypothetical protein